MGVCPLRYTLRQLKWMADRKREHEYDVAISLATFVRKCLFGQFNPQVANPYRNPLLQEDTRTDEEKREVVKESIQTLDAGLRWLVSTGGRVGNN